MITLLGGAGMANAATVCGAPSGALVDLTAGGQTTVNGADLITVDQQATGSGVIQSFVRVSAANQACVQGYNTSGRSLEFDENTSATFTHDLALSAVPVEIRGGVAYYQFLLDINQTGTEPLLSVEQIQIWQSNTASLLGFTPGTGFASVTDDVMAWSLDGAGDVFVKLNYNLNSGSGSGDMILYVPTTYFSALNYVYLFSRFGDNNANNDGYEEWAVREGDGVTFCPPTDPNFPFCVPDTNVPEPGSLVLLGLGMLGLGLARRRAS